MITNRRVFDDEFVPAQLDHRGDEMDVLAWAFKPAARREPARNVLMHGPSGVGKTVLARHMLDRLQNRADVDCAFVECMGLSTAGVLRAILDDLGVDATQNTPLADLEGQLRERIDGPVIIVLDEADGLPDIDALQHVTDVEEAAVVPICHDASDWLSRTDDDVRRAFSGVGSRELELERYRLNDLADILKTRAHVGLRHGVVNRAQLETIADGVAGVARNGIQSLRAAAEIAEEREHSEIRTPDVRDSFERARRRIRKSNLQSLPFHHNVLYEFVRRNPGITGPELHERYEELAGEIYRDRDRTPVGQRSRRNKLQKLKDYDLIDWAGENKHREYWACDTGVQSPFRVSSPAQ